MIEPGKKLPKFKLDASGGESLSNADFAGRKLVVYFYPKDSTPGCTLEAQDFRDRAKQFEKAGVAVVGVSRDSVKSHDNFCAKQQLEFPLLSDPDRAVMTAWGAYGDKVMYGKKTKGVIRSTVWIGPDGAVRKHWARVADAAKHPAHVLERVLGHPAAQ